jgi:hypothetical protein
VSAVNIARVLKKLTARFPLQSWKPTPRLGLHPAGENFPRSSLRGRVTMVQCNPAGQHRSGLFPE